MGGGSARDGRRGEGVGPVYNRAMAAPGEIFRPLGGRRARWVAAGVCALLALAWTLPLSPERTWGYDEVMHAELPALRMLVALRLGEPREAFDALLDCAQYPPGYPIVLAGLQAFTGPSEMACRIFGRLLWALGCFGVFLLAEEMVASLRRSRGERGALLVRPPPGDELVPWLALALAVSSPLVLMYSATLFLEVPFTVASIFALRAFLRRDADHPRWRRRELAAGAWLAALFFLKFNYGVLLWLGVLLELVFEGAFDILGGRGRRFAVRLAWLAAIPALLLAWWLLWPAPAGLARGAEHRAALLAFLSGNQDPSQAVGWRIRLLDWAGFLFAQPRILWIVILGVLCSFLEATRRGPRLFWLLLFAAGGPVWTHNYHQDRFLIPGALALWMLGALGLARLAPRGPRARLAAAGFLLAVFFVAPGFEIRWIADRVGLLPQEPAQRAYALEQLSQRRDLSGDRPVWTAGLLRREADAILELAAAEVGPEESVAWLGASSEMSRGALQIGLLQRGGSPRRFLRDVQKEGLAETAMADPGIPPEEVLRWASRFDVVLSSDPVDLRDRPGRRFLARYRDALRESAEWSCKPIGSIEISAPLGPGRQVEISACRPAGR
jgi:uncharacterized membrane protein